MNTANDQCDTFRARDAMVSLRFSRNGNRNCVNGFFSNALSFNVSFSLERESFSANWIFFHIDVGILSFPFDGNASILVYVFVCHHV